LNKNRFRGMLLGTAVGDSIGLPGEGVPRKRIKRMFQGKWRHRFIFAHGMFSDDTEHTIFVSQCLLVHSEKPALFLKRLGWCLRWWLFSLPAGTGLATGMAIFRLWLGFSPEKSGVFSAGNGPAMRIAPIGAFFSESPDKLAEMVSLCTCITHTDPKAVVGSMAIAKTAAWIVQENISKQPEKKHFLALLRSISEEPEWNILVAEIEQAIRAELSVSEFAAGIGLGNGVSGYIYHTVPVVLYAWYRHCNNFEQTLTSIWECGGDTDTTGAIAGALAGLTAGEEGIPCKWIKGIMDWPRNTSLLRSLADALAEKKQSNKKAGTIKYFWPAIIPRNAFFLIIVLGHGVRRLFPPY
jgi:ADP-ribosyl-[dinitrogen reductase] hydrolase